jgi:hypothetical protein
MIMRTRAIFRTVLLLAIAGVLSSAHALTQEELVAKIQAALLRASQRYQVDG